MYQHREARAWGSPPTAGDAAAPACRGTWAVQVFVKKASHYLMLLHPTVDVALSWHTALQRVAAIASCVTDAFCDRVDSYKLTKPLISHCYKETEIWSPSSVLKASEDADLFVFGPLPAALNPRGVRGKSTLFSPYLCSTS